MKAPVRSKKPLQFAVMTLPWKQLRSHPDIGDWIVNKDNSPAVICAADTGNDISNAAILLHEIIESLLCWLMKVKEEKVTAFDKMFFKEQEEGKHREDDEPGYDPRCPYRIQHLVAERFERAFIEQAGMMWSQHEENCNKVK